LLLVLEELLREEARHGQIHKGAVHFEPLDCATFNVADDLGSDEAADDTLPHDFLAVVVANNGFTS